MFKIAGIIRISSKKFQEARVVFVVYRCADTHALSISAERVIIEDISPRSTSAPVS